MKNQIKLDRELFLSKLSKAMKFVNQKNPIPAFDNLLLIVKSGKMEIISSNQHQQCRISCDVESKTDFAMCLNAKWLMSNISLYRENEVSITQKDEKRFEMKCGKSKGTITIDCTPEGFPMMSMKATVGEITMHQSLLKTALKSTEKFVDEDSMNANMTAINIAEIGKEMVFTGLTQQYMCRVNVKPMAIAKWDSPIAIPTDTAVKASALLDDKGEINVIHDGEKICFFTGSDAGDVFEVMSVTAHVKFPNTEKLFSEKPTNTLSVNTLEFRDAVKRLSMYHEAGMDPKFIMAIEGEDLKLTAEDTMTGKQGEELVSLSECSVKEIRKAFAGKHFLEILSLVESNEFIFHFDTERKPSFVLPKVAMEEENIFAFLIANQAV